MALATIGLGAESNSKPDTDNWVYPKPISAWDEQSKAPQRDAAKKLVVNLRAALTRGDKNFTIAAGDYRFGSGQLPSLVIEGHDIDIDATGANFWFNGQIRKDAIIFKNCRNVRFHGATVDYDPFCRYAQGEVLSLDRIEKTVTIRIDPGFPAPQASWMQKIGNIKAVFFDPQGTLRATKLDWVKDLTTLDGSAFRVAFKNDSLFRETNQVQPGDRLVLPDRSMRMVFQLADCDKVTLEDITIYAAPAMALTEEGGEGGNVYRRCKVVRRPDTRRLIACDADIFHSTKVKHGPLIEECEFSYSCDDAVNVHSFFSPVIQQISPTEAVIVSFFKEDIAPGCELEFYDFDSLHSLGKATVTQATIRSDLKNAARLIPGDIQRSGRKVGNFIGSVVEPLQVILDRPVKLPPFALAMSNLRVAQGTIIRNNYIHDIVTRGLLVKCADGLIENNRIERTGLPGIMLAVDRYFWEGPFPSHIVVKNNHLADAGDKVCRWPFFNGYQSSIVALNEPGSIGSKPDDTPISDIHIENNRIERSPLTGIYLANAEDSSISGNTFIQPGFLPVPPEGALAMTYKAYAIYVTHVLNVKLEGNAMEHPTPLTLGLLGLGADAMNCGPQQ